jgi:hypothetical protein
MPNVARSVIREGDKPRVSSVKNKNFFLSKINFKPTTTKIFEKLYRVGFIKNDNYFLSDVRFKPIHVKAESTLPFRVRFVNIGIESYTPNNPAPIGIAVIGYSNYIL